MDQQDAVPAEVIALFRELGGVLAEARERLDALLPSPPTALPRQRPDREGLPAAGLWP